MEKQQIDKLNAISKRIEEVSSLSSYNISDIIELNMDLLNVSNKIYYLEICKDTKYLNTFKKLLDLEYKFNIYKDEKGLLFSNKNLMDFMLKIKQVEVDGEFESQNNEKLEGLEKELIVDSFKYADYKFNNKEIKEEQIGKLEEEFYVWNEANKNTYLREFIDKAITYIKD